MTATTAKTVLVVEDDEDILDAIADILEFSGHRVFRATNGRQALGQLGKAPFDLILLDLMMPVMNGWQFREEQRRDERFAEIPIVVLSAHADARRFASELGVAAWLKKPVDMSDLLAVVDGAYPR